MRQHLLIIIYTAISFLVAPSIAEGQFANRWYFGNHAGLNFNTSPPSPLVDGQMNAREGCSSICDAEGNILFYTNGATVYDRTHQPMFNSNGLLGHTSSRSAAIIVPKPGQKNIFYIFSADALENNFANGYRFSEVDMNLNGGLGGITSQKNILLNTKSTERLTAARHANGIDYWVITKNFFSQSFMVYKVDCAGVSSSPVISPDPGTPAGEIGTFKVSPDGTMLAMTTHSYSMGRLYRFNNATGTISNAISLQSPPNQWPRSWDLEFSPNSKVLYLSAYELATFNYLFQFDVSGANPAFINASRIRFQTAPSETISGLQLAPDQKIYFGATGTSKMSVINSPDILGPGCDISSQSIDLAGKICNYGMPMFANSIAHRREQLEFSSDVQDCRVDLTITTALPTSIQWRWNMGDGHYETGTTVTHRYLLPGFYSIELTGILVTDCGTSDTLFAQKTIEIKPPFLRVNAGNDLFVSPGSTINLNAQPNQSQVNYSWTPSAGLNSNSIQNPVATVGYISVTYMVTVTNQSGCTAQDEMSINVVSDGNIYLPSAFTPSNDGINDVFRPVGHGLKEIKQFSVFNRYGQLIFKTNKKGLGWDGNFLGSAQPMGTYTYKLIAVTYDGRLVDVSGQVTLIR